MSERLPTSYDSTDRCTGCSSHLSEPHSPACPFADISEEEAQATFERWSGYSNDAATWSADGSHQDEAPRIRREPETNEGGGDDPRLWIGALAAYNSGILHGAWITMIQDLEDVHNQKDNILATSPEPDEEEHYIGDTDNFGELRIDQYESIDMAHVIGNGASDLDEECPGKGQAFLTYLEEIVDWSEDTPDQMRDRIRYFDDVYCGEFDSVEDYVEHYFEDMGIETQLQEFRDGIGWLGNYIKFDVEAYARDIEANSDVFTVDSPRGVYVFRGYY